MRRGGELLPRRPRPRRRAATHNCLGIRDGGDDQEDDSKSSLLQHCQLSSEMPEPAATTKRKRRLYTAGSYITSTTSRPRADIATAIMPQSSLPLPLSSSSSFSWRKCAAIAVVYLSLLGGRQQSSCLGQQPVVGNPRPSVNSPGGGRPPRPTVNITFQPSLSSRPTSTARPSSSTRPSPWPSGGPTRPPGSSADPTLPPTLSPSLVPTSSIRPSTGPTFTPMPSKSARPSFLPSVSPSKPPTVSPTQPPTIAPTISKRPSLQPSISPTQAPTASVAPSSLPSVSMAPSVSAGPSVLPSLHPTISNRPSHLPSQSPSHVPSNNPSSSAPSVFPTPTAGELVRRPYMSMTLYGLDRSVAGPFNFTWAAITSRHVQLYWRSFDRDLAYFRVGHVSTTFISEERIRHSPSSSARQRRCRMLRGRNATATPDPLKVIYSQEIEYDLLENVTKDDLPFYYADKSDLFTVPFEQDGLAYTLALTEELRNNTHLIFMDFNGVVGPPNDTSQRERNILITIITVVLATVCLAGGVICYLTRLRDPDNDVFAPDGSPVGTMIGINTTENILVSESYDDEYKSPRSSAVSPREPAARELANNRPSPSVDGGGGGGTPTGSEPPLRDVQSEYSSSPNIAATISDIGSTGEAGGRTSVGAESVYSSHPAVTAGVVTSPFSTAPRELNEEYREQEDSFIHDDEEESTGEHSATIPFMADFQMEIQDLE